MGVLRARVSQPSHDRAPLKQVWNTTKTLWLVTALSNHVLYGGILTCSCPLAMGYLSVVATLYCSVHVDKLPRVTWWSLSPLTYLFKRSSIVSEWWDLLIRSLMAFVPLQFAMLKLRMECTVTVNGALQIELNDKTSFRTPQRQLALVWWFQMQPSIQSNSSSLIMLLSRIKRQTL